MANENKDEVKKNNSNFKSKQTQQQQTGTSDTEHSTSSNFDSSIDEIKPPNSDSEEKNKKIEEECVKIENATNSENQNAEETSNSKSDETETATANNCQSKEEPVKIINSDSEDNLIEIEDPDDYLMYLEAILEKIHERFYRLYESTQKVTE